MTKVGLKILNNATQALNYDQCGYFLNSLVTYLEAKWLVLIKAIVPVELSLFIIMFHL